MHGWFLETHKRVFKALLSPEKTSVILELGSWYGASTKWLADYCPQATVYAVDLWRDDFILNEQLDHYSTMGERKLHQMLRDHPLKDTFLSNLWDHRDHLVPLCMTTVILLERSSIILSLGTRHRLS